VQVCTFDGKGNLRVVDGNTTIRVSTTPGTLDVGTSQDGPYAQLPTSVTILHGESCTEFYLTSTLAGEPELVVTAPAGTSWQAATQRETVLAGPIAALVFPSDAPPFEPCQVSDPIALETQDQFGNRSRVDQNVRIDLATTSNTGRFGVSATDPFDGSVTDTPLPRGEAEASFYYKDCTLGTPEITAREVPSLGWVAGSQKRTIALKLTVNNQGKVDVTTVSEGNWKADHAILSVSNDGIVTLGLEVTTRAAAADGTRIDLVTVTRIPDPPAPPPGDTLAIAVDLGPSGATFDPPLLLSINYGILGLPSDTDAADIKLSVLINGKWQVIESTKDPKKQTINATISHFSQYAVLVLEKSGFTWLPYGLGGGAGALLLASLLIVAYYRRWSVDILATEGALQAGGTPHPIRLQSRDAKRRAFKPGRDVTVRLTTSSPTGRFDVRSDGAFEKAESKVVVPSSTGEVTIYYRDVTPGSPVLRARSEYRLAKWIWSRWPAKSQARLDLGPPRA